MDLRLAVAAVFAVVVALAVAIGVRKAVRQVGERRRDTAAAALRPHLLAALAADEASDATLPALGTRAERALTVLARELLAKVRGEAHLALVALLEQRGLVDAACRDTRRPGAVRRADAAELLGLVGAARALPDLLRLLCDRDAEVRSVAVRALGRLGQPAAAPDLLATVDAARDVPPGVVAQALRRLGAAGIEALPTGSALSSRARLLTVELSGHLGVTSSLPQLVAAVEADPDPAIRVAAARALGRIGAPRAVDPLIAVLVDGDDEPPALRAAAAGALGAIGATRAAPALATAMGDGDHRTAANAAAALAALGVEGRRHLERVVTAAAHARQALALSDVAAARPAARAAAV